MKFLRFLPIVLAVLAMCANALAQPWEALELRAEAPMAGRTMSVTDRTGTWTGSLIVSFSTMAVMLMRAGWMCPESDSMTVPDASFLHFSQDLLTDPHFRPAFPHFPTGS